MVEQPIEQSKVVLFSYLAMESTASSTAAGRITEIQLQKEPERSISARAKGEVRGYDKGRRQRQHEPRS